MKKFLKSDALTAELAKEQPDPAVIESIVTKYSGDESGLSLPQFQAVRTALVSLNAALAAPPPPADLPTALKETKFTPVTPAEVAKAKAELAAAAKDLEAMLNRSPAGRAAGWKKHLDWDSLVAVLAGDQLPPPATINNIVKHFQANKNGLEMKQFIRTREMLQNYADLAAAAADPQLQQQYQEHFDLLTKHLAAYENNPASGDDAVAAARAAGVLGRTAPGGGTAEGHRQPIQPPEPVRLGVEAVYSCRHCGACRSNDARQRQHSRHQPAWHSPPHRPNDGGSAG